MSEPTKTWKEDVKESGKITDFSKQMKTKRMEKNIYLLDFAKKTKISAVRLANIECGAKPSQEEELKIKRVLGV